MSREELIFEIVEKFSQLNAENKEKFMQFVDALQEEEKNSAAPNSTTELCRR